MPTDSRLITVCTLEQLGADDERRLDDFFTLLINDFLTLSYPDNTLGMLWFPEIK